MDGDGFPLCLHCSGRVLGVTAGTREARFCSNKCMEEYKVGSINCMSHHMSAYFVGTCTVNVIISFIYPYLWLQVRRKDGHCGPRDLLYEVEQGICQICGIDGHSMYEKVIMASADARKGVLEKTPYVKLPVAVLNRMVRNPKEGLVSTLHNPAGYNC